MRRFEESELILNQDGSVFHLHIKPEQLAHKVILVGDPGRVSLVASHFTDIEMEVQSREFHSITGKYQGKRITVASTGIGCDNIDIVVTCGGLQEYTPVGTFIVSEKSIGFDGLLNFYAGRNEVCNLALEDAFTKHMHWNPQLCAPYVIEADEELTNRIGGDDMVHGITIACGGFYGPQGRQLRIPLADPDQNAKVESFEYEGMHITNFEMESSALAGLSKLLGHKATTCCMVIANRLIKEANTGYKSTIDNLIKEVLERI